MLRQVTKSPRHQATKSRPSKDLFLSLLSSILLILSFPNFNFWILSWFGFVPLFFTLKNKSKLKAFFLSYFTGIIFWFGIIYWLVHVTLAGLIVLVLYLALYFGLFGLVVKSYELRVKSYELLFIPSAWVLLEYLRSHLFTGFPWALLGYSQYLNLPIIQIADITGVWGVSFLVMMINVLIYRVISYRLGVRSRKREFILPFLFFFLCLGYGFYKLSATPNSELRTPIKISVIQGNIPQELKWDISSKDFIIDEYLRLSRAALQDELGLIIWPEAALPVVLEEEPLYYEKVVGFIKGIHTPLLLGAVTKSNNLYYNSALLVSSEGELLNRYNKLHLVPLGEYIPLRKIFGFLETAVPIGDFTRGREYTVFTLPTRFSVLICFEDLFPEISRGFVKRGADFLINITNDAWFQKTSSPYQHLAASVLRAVENRAFLVRSANTGISGFIAPSGKIISLVQDKMGRNIFINGYSTQEMLAPLEKNLSFYTRFGDMFILACFLFVLLYSILPSLRKQR